jgi:hypothetical protein
VKVDNMPLARFLDFATTLSAMPVSVASEELRLAAVSAGTAVSVDAKDLTIEQILAAALKPLRLEATVVEKQIVLRRTIGDQKRELSYPVGDLADGNPKQFAGWVQQLVEPEAWQSGGGAGTISIDGESLKLNQSERVGYQTILFLERYRATLALTPQSKYPAGILTAWAGVAEVEKPLSAPATFTFSRPTALGEVFRWWQQELGVAVLVDWPALETQRLAPQTRVLAASAQKPWGEAMTEVLTPIGLGWRPVDAKTIEITSLDRIRTQQVTELYRIGAGSSLSGAGLVQKVLELSGGDAPSSAGRVFYDEAHRMLMVRQPSAIQRRVADYLERAGLAGFRRD